MTNKSTQAKSRPDKSAWRNIVASYQTPDLWRSLWQIANTHIPYVIIWYIMVQTLKISYWLTLPFIFLAAGLLIRNFIIFHDCGHGSFFASRRANEVVGFITGVLNFTPYFSWRHKHALHHASSGDLDRRGYGDIWMMTVNEYLAATPKERVGYRLYRNPFVLFILSPLFLFLVSYRVPLSREKQRERRSVHYTNLALLVGIIVMSFLIGFKAFAILQLSILTITSICGVWVFYVQHQYEGVYWQKHDEWDYATAAVEGSSFYKLPKVLQWFTGNIGFHHIHHLSPRIPNYNLEACHAEITMFRVTSITFRQSLRSLRFRLWDEENNRLITFRELNQISESALAGT
jgi:omega-6 fatty acid desaturase (delta-12 desaturase)